jgi:hypothetical protein
MIEACRFSLKSITLPPIGSAAAAAGFNLKSAIDNFSTLCP